MRREVLLALLSGLAAQVLAQSSNSDLEVSRRQCVQAVTQLLQFGDKLDFNVDWIFYLSGYFDADWYKPKKHVIDALLNSKIPYAVPAQTKELRNNATLDLCTRLFGATVPPWCPTEEPRYRYLDAGPYSALGLARYAQLNARLRAYDVIGGDHVTLVAACSAHLAAVLEVTAQRDVDVEALVARYLGFDPYYSRAKWCTLGVNFALSRTREARDKYKKDGGGEVVFDFKIRFPVVEVDRELIHAYYQLKDVDPWSTAGDEERATSADVTAPTQPV